MSETETPKVDDCPVAISLIHKLTDRYPAWRTTSHTTTEGREVMMIEFADDEYEFTGGLPGDFVEMVSRADNNSESDGGEK